MAYVGAVFVVLGFILLLRVFNLVEKSLRVMAISRQAMRELSDATLDDDRKEVAMRGHARSLFGLFLALTLGSLIAVTAPLGVIWGLDAIGLVAFDAVIAATLSWQFIVGGAILMVAALWRRGG